MNNESYIYLFINLLDHDINLSLRDEEILLQMNKDKEIIINTFRINHNEMKHVSNNQINSMICELFISHIKNDEFIGLDNMSRSLPSIISETNKLINDNLSQIPRIFIIQSLHPFTNIEWNKSPVNENYCMIMKSYEFNSQESFHIDDILKELITFYCNHDFTRITDYLQGLDIYDEVKMYNSFSEGVISFKTQRLMIYVGIKKNL